MAITCFETITVAKPSWPTLIKNPKIALVIADKLRSLRKC